jgi:sec-independent protein translocase protein TatB
MFDIGFTELLVIGVVALLVIGPERMPKVARTAGHLFGRFQRYVSAVKADIGREVELDELRKAGQTFKESVEQAASGVQTGVAEAEFTMKDEAESHIQRVTQAMADLEQHDPLLSPEAEELRAIPEPAAEMPGSQAELALDPPPPSESTGVPVGESAGEPATDNSAEKPA